MKPQFDQKLMKSMALFVDHRIQNSGQAYYDASGLFYPASREPYSNRYTYASPYRGMVNDASVAGATYMTGVYMNGVFVTPGTSGLESINHYDGTVLFSSQPASSVVISGDFSVKEVNVTLTTEQEDQLYFDGKFQQIPKYGQTATGMPLDVYPVPAVFLKKKGADVEPFAIGGTDLSVIDVRAVCIADDEYTLDAVTSILKDTHYRRVEVVDETTLPFDFLGGYTGSNYNYTGIVGGDSSNNGPLIKDVSESRVSAGGAFDSFKNKLYASFIDFKISHVRDH